MDMKKLLLLVFIILLHLYLPIQCMGMGQKSYVKIIGKVVDSNKLNPLPYVNIALVKRADSLVLSGTITNDKGLFTIQSIKDSNLVVRFSLIGYKTKIIPLYQVETTTSLEESVNILSSVIVKGMRNYIKSTPQGFLCITQKQFIITLRYCHRCIKTTSTC